jgi:hypothetical protein
VAMCPEREKKKKKKRLCAHRAGDIVQMVPDTFVQPDFVVVIPIWYTVVAISADAAPWWAGELRTRDGITPWLHTKTASTTIS